jgi:hypothetical protein
VKSKSAFALSIFLFLAATVMWAQAISTSQIRGTIQDASGAAVAGAQVKLTQTGTGAVRTATSGTDGSYSFPELPVGPYQLEVTKEGFTKYVQTGIVLEVGVNPTIDVSLKVGAVTQEVTVQAEAQMVETQSTGVGQVISPQEVQDLPLNGRNVTDLIYLTGGVNYGRVFRGSYPTSTSPAFAGGIIGSVTYMMDGATHNDPLSNTNLPLPFPDAVEEFKVETSSLPAQYGYHSGGAVNVVTKSGTNQFHGDAFEFLRNFMFNARNFYQPVRDPQKENQFGGTLGGPVRKDKLFFFAGFQQTIFRSNPLTTPTFLPTQAMLDGDFSAVTAPPCAPAGTTLNAPFFSTVGGVPNQANPFIPFSPISLALLNDIYNGVGSFKGIGIPTNPCGEVFVGFPASNTERQGLGRIDYRWSDKHSLFARYYVTNRDNPPASPSTGLLEGAITGQENWVQNLTLGDTYLFGSNTVNSVRVMGNRSTDTALLNSTPSLADLGVMNVYNVPSPPFPKFLGISVTGGISLDYLPSIQPYDTIEFRDDLNLVRGAHQLSFGTDYVNLRAFANTYLNANGDYTFAGVITGSPNADFLFGIPLLFNQAGSPVRSYQHQNVFDIYAQDAWKINRRLTITAGLRWDPFFGHSNPQGQVAQFSEAAYLSGQVSTVYPNMPPGLLYNGDPGGPSNKKYTGNKMNEWAPRIGIAWDPKGDGRMSVRAGYGIFYDFPNFSFDQFGYEEPFGAIVTAVVPTYSNPWLGPEFGGVDPFIGNIGTGKTATPVPGDTVFGYQQGTPHPTYVQQYNLSVEKQLGTNWLVSISYIGNVTRHLWLNNDIDPGNLASAGVRLFSFDSPGNPLYRPYGPDYGEVLILTENGTGSYNGMILSARHRFSNHFTSSSNFTWSHCRSDLYTPALGFFFDENMISNDPQADYGNCPSADQRLTFNQSLVAESPKFSNHTTQIVAGNWRLSITGIIQSGQYLTLLDGYDAAMTGNSFTQRPSFVPGVPVYVKTATQWLNPAAFCTPTLPISATNPTICPSILDGYGDVGANSILGPGAIVFNMSLARIFQIRERQQIEFRWDVFNIANHNNPYPPVTSTTAPNFGQPALPASALGVGGAVANPINDPRIMQFALKYIF